MEVSLSKGDKDIPASDHVRYTVFDDYIIILMKEVGKNDEGIYNVTLKNPSGSVSGTFAINVTGKIPIIVFISRLSLHIIRMILNFQHYRTTRPTDWSAGSIRDNQTHMLAQLASSAIRRRSEDHPLRGGKTRRQVQPLDLHIDHMQRHQLLSTRFNRG